MGFRLTTRNLKAVIGNEYLVHVVDPLDPTDNASGTSFKAVLSESYIPLAGTKALFPVLGDIEMNPINDVTIKQIGSTLTNLVSWAADNNVQVFCIENATLNSYGFRVQHTNLVFEKNFLHVGEFTNAEDFGIGQTTASAEYQIASFRALSTRGVQNLWVGRAGNLTSSGVQNTCVGLRSGEALTIGSENVMIGQVCGVLITSGSRNTLFGKETAPVMTIGNDNLFAGYRSGQALTSGNQNTFLGNNSGSQVTTGTDNVFIGRLSGLQSATQRSKSIAIGNNARVDQDNSFILGGTGADFVRVGVGTTIPTAFMDLPFSTTAIASLRIRKGLDVTTPNDGDFWNTSTYNGIVKRLSGVTLRETNVLKISPVSTTIANTAAETSLLNSALSIPANYFTAEKSIRFHISGFLTSTANPNVTLRVKIGGVVVLLSATLVIGNNASNVQFEAEGVITCRTNGVAGTFIGQAAGEITGNTFAAGSKIALLGTATAVVDTTIANNFDVTFQWGAANASNLVTITNTTIEILS